MGSFSVSKKPHAVCIPIPWQGHINVMLKLAKLLHSRGFHITFVNTELFHQKLLKSRGPDSLNGLPDFQFKTIPDGLPPYDIDATQPVDDLCDSIKHHFLAPFRNLIAKLNDSSTPQVTCIISDGCLISPLVVAEELGIPGVLLWPMSASFLTSNLYCKQLVEKGVLPIKDKSDLRELETPVDSFPGLRDLRVKDLPSYFLETDKHPLDRFLVGQVQEASKASAIMINTLDALESEVLQAVKSLLPPIYSIGPLQLLSQETSSNQLSSIGSNLLKEDAECLKWLDSKQPASVVYVNFGSVAVLSQEQLIEFAWGLANSKHPFLWVIRPGLVTGDDAAVLPPEFVKETADRGLISGWCPQEEVLNHSSIGGFLTHSGWNSTMDTVSSGVAVMSWPFVLDQQMNCRYACAHWGIGMEINKDVKRDEVEGAVRELMEGEKGKKMKKRVMEWKKVAEESTKPGGSSYVNMDRIVSEVLRPNKQNVIG